jgi:hypothetical protein
VSLASDPHAILIRACGTENEDRWTGMIAAPVTCVVAPRRREKDAGIFRMKSKKNFWTSITSLTTVTGSTSKSPLRQPHATLCRQVENHKAKIDALLKDFESQSER